jgi:hypothetical protein
MPPCIVIGHGVIPAEHIWLRGIKNDEVGSGAYGYYADVFALEGETAMAGGEEECFSGEGVFLLHNLVVEASQSLEQQ